MKVVAGPILRRVSPTEVAVWLATIDAPGPLVVEVRDAAGGGAVLGSAIAVTLQFGTGLYIHFARVPPTSGTYPTGKLLTYDYEMGLVRLADLAKNEGLTYGNHPLPTFLIQPPSSPLRLLAASCRKLHGPSTPSGSPEYDALHIADDIIRDTVNDTSARPHLLVLSGDQIYADGVAFELLPVLEAIGKLLVGTTLEVVPGLRADAVGGARSETTKAFRTATGFTTNEGGCHLTRFSDFAAMYCVAWKDHRSYAPALTKTSGEVVEHLKASLAAVRMVRRVLANVSTAMIFDDHEITDDWYFDQIWKDAVLRLPAGKRIIANGLAAYAAFQAWGNDPAHFPMALLETISKRMKDGPDTNGKLPDGAAFDSAMLRHPTWTYDTHSSPPVVVPDSRTQRGSTSAKPRGGVALLQPAAVSDIASRLAAGGRSRPQVIVMATPPFVPAKFAWLQTLSPLANDDEGFAGNAAGWTDLLEMFLTVGAKPLVILSGDVHFGFIAKVTLRRVGWSPAECTILQVTASACKNATTAGKAGALQAMFPPLTIADVPPIFGEPQLLTDARRNAAVAPPVFGGTASSRGKTYTWEGHIQPLLTANANLALLQLTGSGASAELLVRTSGSRSTSSSLRL